VLKGLASPAGPAVARVLKRKLSTLGTIGTLLADTVSPTNLEAGYKDNVVPGEATAALDCRLLPDTDVGAFVSRVQRESGPHVEVTARRVAEGPVSPRGATFDALAAASRLAGDDLVVVPSLTPGFTDLRHFRKLGGRAYGWAPLVLSPELLATIHGHDERIPLEGFLSAVGAMTEAVRLACR
jgi:acetylornithine deacetylase/succinyl-diaminopimelate desuccinylase-like protein